LLSYRDHQERVDSYFDSSSHIGWRSTALEVCRVAIHQQRMAVVLRWVENLSLPERSIILEVGCGAGLTTLELARRGYVVDALDSSEAIVERTLRGVAESGAGGWVTVLRGDAVSLPFENNSSTLVVAMGAVPWLELPDPTVREIARVAKPGGYVILNSDNLMRLNYLIDPHRNPGLAPLRHLARGTSHEASSKRRNFASLPRTRRWCPCRPPPTSIGSCDRTEAEHTEGQL